MAATATTATGLSVAPRRHWNQEAVEGYVCIAPWLIGFLCFVAGPMIAAFLISLTHWSLLEPPEFIGLENYRRLYNDPMFYTSLVNTGFISFLAVPLQLTLALLIALALNEKLSGLMIYRTIFYLPSQMPIVASALLWLWVFNPDFGLANAMLYLAGLPGLGWLFDPSLSKPSIVLITLWGGIGTPLIIFLAGLESVPDTLYEAASIDGAGPFARFRNITLPMLSPIIFFNLIIGIIASFQAYFTLVFVTTQGGPANSTMILILYIYFKAFRDFDMSYASALAWVLFLIVLVLTAINFGLARLWVHYEGGTASLSPVATQHDLSQARPEAAPRVNPRRRRSRLNLVLHVVLIALSILYLLPFVWMLSTSLKVDGQEIAMPPQWIPDPVVWSNYVRAMTASPMLWYLRNTLIVTVTATVLGVLAASLAGYAFARLRFPGRNVLFSLCLATLMLPGIVTLIPEFLLFRYLNWINTFLPLIVPWSLGGHALGIFLFRQYALTIPYDFDEAARVDGAGALRIWWSIIVPLSGPALATLAILAFIHHWNDFLRPLVFLQERDLRTLAIGLRLFRGEFLVQWNLLMAASTLMLLPVLALFFAAQRYFVQGIVMSGLKG